MMRLNKNRKGEPLSRIILSVMTVLLCTGTLLAAEHGGEPPEGKVTLTVEVINGTESGQDVSGDEVTVSVYRHEEFVTSVTAPADANAEAVFTDIPGEGHLIGMVHVMHQNMRFGGSVISLASEGEVLSASVTVYDVSVDNSVLLADTYHVIMKPDGENVFVTEYLQLRNPTSYAVSSSEMDSENRPIVLHFDLGKNYKKFESAEYFLPDALGFEPEGFYDTMAIPPGSHEIIFSYAVPGHGKSITIKKRLSFATKTLVLFSYLGAGAIEGLGVPQGHLVSNDGMPADYYNLVDQKAGSEIMFKISGSATSSGDRTIWFILSITFGVIIAIALIRFWYCETQAIG